MAAADVPPTGTAPKAGGAPAASPAPMMTRPPPWRMKNTESAQAAPPPKAPAAPGDTAAADDDDDEEDYDPFSEEPADSVKAQNAQQQIADFKELTGLVQAAQAESQKSLEFIQALKEQLPSQGKIISVSTGAVPKRRPPWRKAKQGEVLPASGVPLGPATSKRMAMPIMAHRSKAKQGEVPPASGVPLGPATSKRMAMPIMAHRSKAKQGGVPPASGVPLGPATSKCLAMPIMAHRSKAPPHGALPKGALPKRIPAISAFAKSVVRRQAAEFVSDPEGVKRSKAARVGASVAGWLKRGFRPRAPSRMETGAALAEEYFAKKEAATSSEPAAKRSRGGQEVEAATAHPVETVNAASAPALCFAEEMLEKVPTTLQTCRSLLLFLDKKLEVPVKEPPAPKVPDDMIGRFEDYATTSGRLEAIRSKAGWDARAKRVLDIASFITSPAGEALLCKIEKRQSSREAEFLQELRERALPVLVIEDVVKERREWAREHFKLEWLAWCARLLRFQEASLVAEAEGKKLPFGKKMSLASVCEAMLSSDIGRASSKAGA